jgi:peptide/nickel transport system substrate-binding protein
MIMTKQRYPASLMKQPLLRRRLLGAGALVGAGTALAGCSTRLGRGRGQSPSPSGAAGKPRAGGTLLTPVPNDPSDWDMGYLGRNTPNNLGQILAYDTLLSAKHGPDVRYEDLVLQPALAERWETPDAQTYTFHIRKGVTFADLPPVSGRELTAADIKWTYEYWSRSGQFRDKNLPVAQYGWFFEGMRTIETPDSSTVVIRFDQPFAPFINYTGSYWNPIVPRDIYEHDGNLKSRMVGTGPFQLDPSASQKGTRWVFKKNPSYWDAGKPYIDQVEWVIVPDDSTTIAAFQSKQVDILGATGAALDFNTAKAIKAANPAAVMYPYVTFGPLLFIYINNRAAPLNDRRVRQAISLATDPDEFINTFAGGQGERTLAGAFPDTFTQQEIKQLQSYDPAQAKQLLSAAGYANGLDLEFIFNPAYGQLHVSGVQLFQAQMRKAGINVTLKSMDSVAVSNARAQGKYLLTATPRTTALVGDVDSYAYANFHTGSANNQSFVSDSKLDALLEAQRRELDQAKRKDLVRQAVRLIVEEAYSIAIFRATSYQFWQPYLKGYAPNFGTLGVPQADSWLQK